MQTKEQIKEKVLQIIPDIAEQMAENLERILANCELVVDLEKYDNNYLLPKMIICALLEEEKFQYGVYLDKKESKSIEERFYAML